MRPSFPIRVAVATARTLPRSVVFFAARMMGWIGYLANQASRKRALENVRACFPHKPNREHRRIALKGFQHMALVAMDAMRAPKDRPGMMRHINVRNLHYVTDSLQKGKGVVLITGHFGNVAVLPVA